MKLEEKLVDRLRSLIADGDAVLASEYQNQGRVAGLRFVDDKRFYEWMAASLSYLVQVFGQEHTHTRLFQDRCKHNQPSDAVQGQGILKAAMQDLQQGHLTSLRALVSADVFSDFLEMAAHLSDNGYKDAAAVMIGSTLEEHLRNLCHTQGIDTTIQSNGKEVPKKADVMNADLVKRGVYGKLEQKMVTAWLDLRNKAAHGEYSEYSKEHVEQMNRGVMQFISHTTSTRHHIT